MAADFGVGGDGGDGAFGHSIGSACGDLDDEGHLDLFVGNFSHPPAYQDRSKFYKNLGPSFNYHLEDKSAVAALHWQESYASLTLGDYNNDGDLDLYLTTIYAGDHSILYRNEGDWLFTDVTGAFGVATEQTYQAAWADFNNDGFLDLFAGGRLFKNLGGSGHCIKVRVIGDGQTVNSSANRYTGENHTGRSDPHSASGRGNGSR